MPLSAPTPSLVQTFSDVLANLAFMLTADQGDAPPPDTRWLITRISYQGPCSGEVTLRCPEGFAGVLASNLLGIEPNDPEAHAKSHDAMKELMNVLCGQIVTSLHGTESIFSLSIPELQVLDADQLPAPPQDAQTASVFVEGYPVTLFYRAGT